MEIACWEMWCLGKNQLTGEKNNLRGLFQGKRRSGQISETLWADAYYHKCGFTLEASQSCR